MARVLTFVAVLALAGAALAAGVVHLGWECYALNFRYPADPRNPYVYAHTSTDTLKLAAQIERFSRVSPEGHRMMIHVVTPENYWPLPWYLRRFDRDRVGYWQESDVWARDTSRLPPPSVIILTAQVMETVDRHLGGDYHKGILFGLRPGVLLYVYVREDLWQAFLRAAS